MRLRIRFRRLIDRHKLIFIKPLFRCGVATKGKAGLIGRARDLKTALAEKERLYSPSIVTAMPWPKCPTRSPSSRGSGRARGVFRHLDDTRFRRRR